MRMQQTDFLVIGSGIAGLSFAIKCAQEFPDRTILIITKASADETNTKYAQGGIAVVSDTATDSFEKHIEDTLIAGDGLCNEAIVRKVVEEGPARVDEIIEWGAQFDKDDKGSFKKGKEGGHSAHRILHHKDVTGQEMERALLQAVESFSNIQLSVVVKSEISALFPIAIEAFSMLKISLLAVNLLIITSSGKTVSKAPKALSKPMVPSLAKSNSNFLSSMSNGL